MFIYCYFVLFLPRGAITLKGKLRKRWFNRQFRVPEPWGAKHSRALASGAYRCRRSAENSQGVEAFPVWSLPQVQPTRICVHSDTFTCLNEPSSFKEFGNKQMTYCAEHPFIPSSKNKIIVTLTKGRAFSVHWSWPVPTLQLGPGGQAEWAAAGRVTGACQGYSGNTNQIKTSKSAKAF